MSQEDMVKLVHISPREDTPRQPNNLTLSWRNLSVFYNRKVSQSFWKGTKTERVQIIDSVNGIVQSGNLVAILGPSGAGKTTLLAAISSRVRGDIQGKIKLNGKTVSPSLITKISGFVPQNDLAFEMLTVGEHMEFMAKLKMDRYADNLTRKRRIVELIQQLGIQKCYHTTLQSLSGGERRRLSLAVQIINDPPLLFCDEPTTGLDSWAAASVVEQLRDLASAGKAVVCSIHQPASGITDMFHQTILVAGGRIAFQGPVSEASQFFKDLNYPCPVGFNEAEFLVSKLSTEESANKICSSWTNDDRNKTIKSHIDTMSDAFSISNGSIYKSKNNDAIFNQYFPTETPGKLIQLYWLIWRSCVSALRDKKIWLAEFISFMGISLLLAVPFQNVLTNIDQTDIQNIQGLMYLIVTETIFTFVYCVFNQFPSELGVLLRDIANGLYTPGPYYIARMLYLLPRAIFEPFLYTTMIFWIVGLKGGFYTFALFTVPVIFAANCANAYGTWLSATFESPTTASLISVPVDLICLMFSGTFLNLASAPEFLYGIKYISTFYYSCEAVSILQWRGVEDIACNKKDGISCITSGKEVLQYYGYDTDNYHFDLVCMAAIYSAFHILGFISLLIRSRKQPVY